MGFSVVITVALLIFGFAFLMKGQNNNNNNTNTNTGNSNTGNGTDTGQTMRAASQRTRVATPTASPAAARVPSQSEYCGGKDTHGTQSAFPSGEWSGYYMQQRDTRGYRTATQRRDDMSLHLSFEAGRISGRGSDTVGTYTITGQYNSARLRCAFAKRYTGEDYVVEYRGERSGEDRTTRIWHSCM